MSATKNIASNPPSSSLLCLETELPPETAWLYTHAPGTPQNSIRRLYPIIPNCGVSLLKQVFEFDNDKEACYVFSISKENQADVARTSSRTPNNYYPGSELYAYRPTISTYENNWIKFVLFLSTGNDGNADSRGNNSNGEHCKRRIETMILHPITLSLKLTRANGSSWNLESDFVPAVTQSFDMENIGTRKNDKHVIYHTVVRSSDAKWSWKLYEFLDFESGGPLPSLQIKGAKAPSSPLANVFELEYNKIFTPFALVSKDGKKYHCYKEVLCAKIPGFDEKLKEAAAAPAPLQVEAGEMKVSVGSRATQAFLEQVYHPQRKLPCILTVDEMSELLQLAYRFQLPELIGTCVKRLLRDIHGAGSTALWNLFGVLWPLKYEIEIVLKLWTTLVTNIRSRILDTSSYCDDLDEVEFDSRRDFLNLKSYAECGADRINLLDNLCQELENTPNEGISKEDFKIQLLFKRFQIQVIRKISSANKNDDGGMSPPSSSAPSRSSSSSESNFW